MKRLKLKICLYILLVLILIATNAFLVMKFGAFKAAPITQIVAALSLILGILTRTCVDDIRYQRKYAESHGKLNNLKPDFFSRTVSYPDAPHFSKAINTFKK